MNAVEFFNVNEVGQKVRDAIDTPLARNGDMDRCPMTRTEAEEWVRDHADDDPLDDDDLEAVFFALYDRRPDDEDRENGLWSLCCSAVEDERTAYRVYKAPDGCDPSFCGEYETLEEAQEKAETEPAGLGKSLWDTARAAGHCGGMSAPEGGVEDDEPESCHGAMHYVVRVVYSRENG